MINERVCTPYHHFFFDLAEISSMQNVYSFTYLRPSDPSFKVDEIGIPIGSIPSDGDVYTQMGNYFYVPTGIASRVSSVNVYDSGNLIGRAEFNRNCSIFPPMPTEELDEYCA